MKDRVFDIATILEALRRNLDEECVIDPTITQRQLGRPRAADHPPSGLSTRT